VAVAGGADRDSSITVEEYVAVDILNPHTLGALGDQFEIRAWIRGIYEFGIGRDDGLSFWSGQRGFNFGTLGWS
jgi:hypothetical protein